MDPLSSTKSISMAVGQDPKLAYNPDLIKKFQSAGGALSNGAIPGLSTNFPLPQGGTKVTPVVTSKAATDNFTNMGNTITQSNQDIANAGQVRATGEQQQSQVDAQTQAQADAKPQDDTSALLKALGVDETNTQQDVATADQAQNEIDTQRLNDVSNALVQMSQGAYPLSATEQASVANLRTTFAGAFQDAQDLTKAQTMGVTKLNARDALQMYSPQEALSNIAKVVKQGSQKINDLNTQLLSKQNDLTQAFQDKDYKTATLLYNQIHDTIESRKNEINDINKSVADAKKELYTQAKDAQDRIDKQQAEVTQNKNNILMSLGKSLSPVPPEVVQAVQNAPDVGTAIAAAGQYLQDTPTTGTLGEYFQYKRDAEAQGLVPKDYETFKDEQDAKANQKDINKAYAVEQAKNQSDANFTASDKTQQKLEQQYRQVLSKEFSSRTGSLGIENSKVNQANHLNSLFTQYYDPKTKTYNVPKTQYAELAIGLANLVSPTGSVSDSARDAIMTKTAKGDFNGAISYITGTPQNGTTQAVIQNLVDSVDRQAQTATRNREAALQNMRDQAPTDLEQSRIDKLNKSTEMVGYEGQNRISKANVDSYIKANPAEAESVAKLYEVPGATDKDIEDYLKAQGKLQ